MLFVPKRGVFSMLQFIAPCSGQRQHKSITTMAWWLSMVAKRAYGGGPYLHRALISLWGFFVTQTTSPIHAPLAVTTRDS